jgi:hypothetical protein
MDAPRASMDRMHCASGTVPEDRVIVFSPVIPIHTEVTEMLDADTILPLWMMRSYMAW